MIMIENSKFWSKEDEGIIRQNHGHKTLPQIMKMLKRKISYYAMRSKCQRMGLYRNRSQRRLPTKNTFNLEYWKTPNLTNCYLAGLVSGDGCIFINKHNSYVFSYKCSIKDQCIIDLFIKELNYSGIIKYQDHKSPHSENVSRCCYITMIPFDQNAKYLAEHFNLRPKKTKRLGTTNLKEKELNLAYLIGNIDSDGTVSTRTCKNTYGKEHKSMYIHFCSSSKKFVEWIKQMMDEYFPPENLNKSPQVRKDNLDDLYKYVLNGQRAANVFLALRELDVPKLHRKWENPKVLDLITQKYL